jgi:hypothetical protein
VALMELGKPFAQERFCLALERANLGSRAWRPLNGRTLFPFTQLTFDPSRLGLQGTLNFNDRCALGRSHRQAAVIDTETDRSSI